jgi:hypothetical protein
MLTHVEFRSDLFPPYEGEELLINPDLWGKRLTEFLRDKLRGEGFETDEPIAEDWGWVVPIANKGFRLWVGCGHYQEHADAYLCFIEPHRPFMRRFFWKIDIRERLASLQRAMDKVLAQAEGIREKRWWTYEQFSSPRRKADATPR